MPFRKVQSERLADAVVRQIEELILKGVLHPGDRLPAERELAERMGVSRPSLRAALAELQDNGLVETRAGSGVYVAEFHGSAFSAPLRRLFARHEQAAFDYIDFRSDLEGMAAARAATFGSATDLAVIDAAFRAMERASGKQAPEEEARLDAAFHAAIVEASHNVVLLQMVRSMLDLLREGVFYNRRVMFEQRTTRASLLAQHAAINAAIQARDPAAATAAVQTHLSFVKEALSAQQRRARNEETALARHAGLAARRD